MIPQDAKIYIAGHLGMVGSACVRKFEREGYTNLVTRSRDELDLAQRPEVEEFFRAEKPEYVVLAAAKVGGILANQTYMAEFLAVNLDIQNNVIRTAFESGVKKLCFLGSSCIYPAAAPQPIQEEYLLTGPLEPTNEGYALAKICGLKLCHYLRGQYGFQTVSLMPCNLYGTNDNYHPEHSHVFPALIRRFVEAARGNVPEVTLWGSGNPLREFMHVDDVANAVFYFLNHHFDSEVINVGYGSELTIRELAEKIAATAGYRGNITWDNDKPDGMFRKLLDSSKARSLGWQPQVTLEEGIEKTIKEYREMS